MDNPNSAADITKTITTDIRNKRNRFSVGSKNQHRKWHYRVSYELVEVETN